MSVCEARACTREARGAIVTSRPSRDNVYSRVWWDDRAEKVPRSAERLCKQHLTSLLASLADVLLDEDEETVLYESPHPATCWCGGTGWRKDLGVKCNMGGTENHPAPGATG